MWHILVKVLNTVHGAGAEGVAAGSGKATAQLSAQVAQQPGLVDRQFGLVVSARLYRQLTGRRRFDRFATSQRGWALGANAWGASLMIGAGSNFPRCPQHVVANLSGNQNGRPPILRGAVVNGPNDASLFEGGLGEFFEEGRTCPRGRGDRYRRFTARGSRFIDDVRSWQTAEPAADFTAAAGLAFALLR